MAFLAQTGQALATTRILLVVLPAFLMYGYDQSSLGGVLSFKSFTRTFPRIDTVNTKGSQQADNARVQGTIVALYTLGCVFGALGITKVGNRIGRRGSVTAASILATLGAIIQASSTTLAQLIVGRILSGLGVGGVNVMVPIWQSECASTKSRGMNVVVLGIFIASGIAIAAWVNFGLSFVEESSVSWRFPLAMPGFFSLLLIAFTPLFPESPRWLVSKLRLDEARETLRVISGANGGDNTHVEAQLRLILDVEQREASNHPGFIDFFRSNKERLFYRACLAVFINFGAQMTGAAVISYYGTTLFRDSLGLPSHEASLLNAGVLTWKIVSAVIPFLTVDRFGRKPLFMVSAAGMSLSMLGLAATVSHISSYAASVAATLFVFLFMTFFPIGFLGANFLFSAETAPQDLRIYLSAIGTATHWLFNFVVAEITPIAFVTIGWRYYIVFAVIGASMVPMVYFCFPETKGRSLEEMGDLFTSPEHWWQVPMLARTEAMAQLSGYPVVEDDKETELAFDVENKLPFAFGESLSENRV